MHEVQIARGAENSQPLSMVMDRKREAKRSGSRSLLFIDGINIPYNEPTGTLFEPVVCCV